MTVPAIVDAASGDPDWLVFAASAAVTLFVGVALVLTNRVRAVGGSIRQAFILVTVGWVVMAAFAALPFAFSQLDLSYTDAFFEAMSGVTTTGSTVITGLDYAPPGILLWRGLLEWLGGIGIIVMAVSVLPMLRVGGMQLFRMEFGDASDKVLPRAGQIVLGIALIYIVLTLICGSILYALGMTGLEATVHAMTTIATGGFSTSDQSVGIFDSAAIDWVITVFMLAGGMPFVLYLQAVRGNPRQLLRDRQVHWFLVTALVAVLVLAGWLWVSIMTGTGYATGDYGTWGGFAVTAFLILMFIGGCAGSTTCGIKVFRFQVLFAAAGVQMRRLLQPNGVFIPYYNRQPISEGVIMSVLAFLFIYALCFALLSAALGLIGLDFLTALSGAATAISNVGPALGEIIGPAGTFAPLPDSAKWILSLGMLLGRLELFSVLVLFMPAFWRG
ncbi:MAG: TrkH family potassium uptake protein [Alphaproteobacteria bacterium]